MPLEYALEQKNYAKWNKNSHNNTDKVYNYLCLTGEVILFYCFSNINIYYNYYHFLICL
jgi:hypothetical protein